MLISDVSIRRPVLATVVSLLLIVLGLFAFTRLPLRELPDIDPPVVSINTTYTGASAGVVETRITQVLEDAVSGIEGVDLLTSNSRTGRSSINIEFSSQRDIESAANDVRDAVSRVLDNLPEDVDTPRVAKADADSEVILWANLTGAGWDTLALTDYADRYLVDKLSSIDGVSQVNPSGDQAYAMRVWPDPAALAARKLGVADVQAALRRENIELPGGSIESTDRDFTVRVERGFRFLTRFGPHDLLDTQPLLEIAFRDHVKQYQTAIGILGATTGIMHGPFAFRCVIDYSEKLAAMPFQTRQPC